MNDSQDLENLLLKTVVISRLNVGSHAGQKAPHDVRTIALRLGARPLDLAPYNSTTALTRLISSLVAGGRLLAALPALRRAGVVITQHPLGKLNDLVLVAMTRRTPTVTLIHDLEMLRWSNHSLRESERLARSTVLIAPTAAMAEHLRSIVPDATIIDLERFDYLVEDRPALAQAASGPARVVIAGSLDPVKAPYVYELEHLALPLDLYGPNCAVDRLRVGVSYQGIISTAYPALNERDAFGLVWDGTSVHELAGPTGRYLHHNAPHKFSLYMALGLPVLVSRDSALAPLVQRHGLGLLIDDVPSGVAAAAGVAPARWHEMVRAVEAYREGLLRGEGTTAVLTRAIDAARGAATDGTRRGRSVTVGPMRR